MEKKKAVPSGAVFFNLPSQTYRIELVKTILTLSAIAESVNIIL